MVYFGLCINIGKGGARGANTKRAFRDSLPVLTGFGFLGMAYGILMSSKGYGTVWSLLMSALAFCGSMQFVAVTLLTTAFDPVQAFLMSLAVNARHLVYGISMLAQYRGIGKSKPLLVALLCDETFSIVCGRPVPKDADRTWYYIFVSLLDYVYWVTASFLGGLLGGALQLNIRGLDSVLTALFVVMFVEQWMERTNRRSALIGVGAAAVCLWLFGADRFLILAMLAMLAALLMLRRKAVTP